MHFIRYLNWVTFRSGYYELSWFGDKRSLVMRTPSCFGILGTVSIPFIPYVSPHVYNRVSVITLTTLEFRTSACEFEVDCEFWYLRIRMGFSASIKFKACVIFFKIQAISKFLICSLLKCLFQNLITTWKNRKTLIFINKPKFY